MWEWLVDWVGSLNNATKLGLSLLAINVPAFFVVTRLDKSLERDRLDSIRARHKEMDDHIRKIALEVLREEAGK